MKLARARRGRAIVVLSSIIIIALPLARADDDSSKKSEKHTKGDEKTKGAEDGKKKDKDKEKDKEKPDSPSSKLESSEARTVIDRVTKAIADKEWSNAFDAARELQEKHGDKLLDGGAGALLTSGQALRRALATLPTEGRDELAKWSAEDLRKQLPLARSAGAAALERLADRVFPLDAGADALILAGDLALEEGSPIAAWVDWRDVLEFHPSQPARVRAAERLAASLRVFKDPALSEDLAQEIGDIAEIDSRDALADSARAVGAEIDAKCDVAKIALGVSSGGAIVRLRDVAPPDAAPAADFDLPMPDTAKTRKYFDPLAPIEEVPANTWPFPPPQGVRWVRAGSVVARDVVVVHFGRGLIALDARAGGTGDRLWSRDMAGIGGWLAALPGGATLLPRYGAAVSRGVVYATLRATSDDKDDANVPLGKLVALDLEDGSRIFEKKPARAKMSFLGAPLVANDRVYCGGSGASPALPNETCVAALDQGGKQVWRTPLASSDAINPVAQPWQPSIPRAIPAPTLALAHGALIVCSQNGLVAALDARDGRVLWARAYPHEEPPSQQNAFNDRGALNTALLKRAESPPVVVLGHAFVLPSDTSRASWLRLTDGGEVKSYSRRNGDHDKFHDVLGVANGKLVLWGEVGGAGHLEVWRLRKWKPPTFLWQRDHKTYRPAGRPALTTSAVLAPFGRQESNDRGKLVKKWKGGIWSFPLDGSGDPSLAYKWTNAKQPEAGDLVLGRARVFVVGFGRAYAYAEAAAEEDGK